MIKVVLINLVVFSYFVMNALNYPGVPGLFVASITAGALRLAF